MNEIPFVTEEAASLEGKELTNHLADRFHQLALVTDKLSHAGWSAHLTITGLAISPPDADDTAGDDLAVDEELKALGIDEQVGSVPGRTLEDLIEIEDEYTQRAWYEAQDRCFRDPQEVICNCCQSGIDQKMADLEETYGRRSLLMPGSNDYERGVLHGKLEAVKWMLGDEMEEADERHLREKCEHVAELMHAVHEARNDATIGSSGSDDHEEADGADHGALHDPYEWHVAHDNGRRDA